MIEHTASQAAQTEILTPENGKMHKPETEAEINSLYGLRGLAVLLTMSNHLLLVFGARSGEKVFIVSLVNRTRGFWDFTGSGVELFFVLSGFLLFLPYSKAILNQKTFPSIRKFYTRRALRILPGYWSALIIIILLLKPENLEVSNLNNIALHFLFLHNWNLDTWKAINGPFWSMSVEVHFYLLLPLLALVLNYLYKASIRYFIGSIVFLGITSIIYGAVYIYLEHYQDNRFFLNHITIFDVFAYSVVFLFGMSCSFIFTLFKEARASLNTDRSEWFKRFAKRISIVGFVVIFLYILASAINPTFKLQYRITVETCLGFGYSSILLGVLIGWKSWEKAFSNPFLRFIGVISYSLYIWNYPLYNWVLEPLTRNIESSEVALLVLVALTFILVIPISWVSYYFVERPFITYRIKQH